MPLRNSSSLGESTAVAMKGDRLGVGEFVPPRNEWRDGIPAWSSGIAVFTHFTADKSESISTITAYTGGTAAGATPTVCRMAVFTVATDGSLDTQVAVTPNDTALFAAINTPYSKAFSTPFTKVAGQRYACGLVVVSGAAMPVLLGAQYLSATNTGAAVMFALPSMCSRIAGQTDMPSSVAIGSLIAASFRVGFKLT